MIPANMFGEKHNIVRPYCFFIFWKCLRAFPIQRLKIVWNAQLGDPRTCEYDLYGVRIDSDSFARLIIVFW